MQREELRYIEEFKVFPGVPSAKMDQNEAPADIPAAIRRRIDKTFRAMPLNRYMTPSLSAKVREEIAAYCGVAVERVAAGAGADSMIHTLTEIFAGGGGRVFCFSPSYPLYAMFAVIAGAVPVTCELSREDFSIDEAEMRRSIKDCDMAFIAYPNNPTGNLFDRELIIAMIAENSGCHFVLDEAYYEYCGDSFAGLLGEYDNLTVIRTFSKYFSMPSLRLGYALSSPKTAALIRKCQFEPYNISSYAAVAGITMLKERGLMRRPGLSVISAREKMIESISAIRGLKAFPSVTNFVFVRADEKSDIASELYARGVYVRDYSRVGGCERCFRVTVGSEKENGIMLNALKDIMYGRSD